jgi:hypothetical protein
LGVLFLFPIPNYPIVNTDPNSVSCYLFKGWNSSKVVCTGGYYYYYYYSVLLVKMRELQMEERTERQPSEAQLQNQSM